MRRSGTILAFCALCLLAGVAQADEPARVYTNADLADLPPVGMPAAPEVTPPARADERGWAFVQEFLARERARIDADRQWEIERRLNEARVDTLNRESRRERYTAPYYFGFGRYPGGVRPNPRDRDQRQWRPLTTSERFGAAHRRLQGGGRIVPIHARPGSASPRQTGGRR